MRLDTAVWIQFLERPAITYRPILDFDPNMDPTNLKFYSDASKNPKLGFGCVLKRFWTYGQWNEYFIRKCDPSIEYLELFGVVAGVLSYADELRNDKFVIHCDNQSVVQMLNNSTSSCRNCMVLLRILTLDNFVHNRMIIARFMPGVKNQLADSLSSLKFRKNFSLAPLDMNKFASPLSERIWPMEKLRIP